MTIKFFNDPERLWKLFTLMLDGAGVTLSIFFLTLVFSVPLGMLVAQGRMSRRRLVRAPLSFYIYIMRSTPLMLQIMFIYFLLPQVLPFRVDRFWAVIFAFVINYAAYFAEIFRSGIQSIPAGQYEAAKVLGYTGGQTFLRIILPLVVPALVTSGVFSFIWRWEDFLAPLLYLNRVPSYTMAIALKMFSDPTAQSDWGAMFAMSTLSLVPAFLIFAMFQKYLVEGIATSGLKG